MVEGFLEAKRKKMGSEGCKHADINGHWVPTPIGNLSVPVSICQEITLWELKSLRTGTLSFLTSTSWQFIIFLSHTLHEIPQSLQLLLNIQYQQSSFLQMILSDNPYIFPQEDIIGHRHFPLNLNECIAYQEILSKWSRFYTQKKQPRLEWSRRILVYREYKMLKHTILHHMRQGSPRMRGSIFPHFPMGHHSFTFSVCIYIYIYVYIYIHNYVCNYVRICISVCICLYTYITMYVTMYVSHYMYR